MTNVIKMESYSYLRERSDAVLLLWQDSEFMQGWVKVAGVDDLASLVMGMLEATPGYQIGIREVGRMTPDMSIEDFYETLAGMSDEVGENPGWFKVNRKTAEATIEHLIDIRLNPIHSTDFEPTA